MRKLFYKFLLNNVEDFIGLLLSAGPIFSTGKGSQRKLAVRQSSLFMLLALSLLSFLLALIFLACSHISCLISSFFPALSSVLLALIFLARSF